VRADDPDQIVAVARCVRLEPGGEVAEFAIVVADPVQREGLGSVLAAALAEAACRVGIRRFAATTLADNDAAQRLLDTFATRLEHQASDGGVRELIAELPDCTHGRLAA
jgi:acetyltransferase